MKKINGMGIIKTGWGAVIPQPVLQHLRNYIPLKYIISIADKAKNYKWITPRGRLHVDYHPYHIYDDMLIVHTNKYIMHISQYEMTVLDTHGRLVFYTRYPYRAFCYLKALVLLNRQLNERELKTA